MSDEPSGGIPFKGEFPIGSFVQGDRYEVRFDGKPGRRWNREEIEAQYQELKKTLRGTTEIDKYRGDGTGHAFKSHPRTGTTQVKIMGKFIGLPLCDLVLAYARAYNPERIRISTGCVTCDSSPGRITITVNEKDVITDIYQEVRVGYACGAEIERCLREFQEEVIKAELDKLPPLDQVVPLADAGDVRRDSERLNYHQREDIREDGFNPDAL